MGPLKPIGLTFVEYEAGNPFAMLLAYSSLTPIFLVVAFVTVMISRRELHAFSFFTGQMFCEIITIILKKYFQHPRPIGNYLWSWFSKSQGSNRTGFGMPSEHSSFVFFFAIYATLFLFKRAKFEINILKHLLSAAMIAAASVVAFSR